MSEPNIFLDEEVSSPANQQAQSQQQFVGQSQQQQQQQLAAVGKNGKPAVVQVSPDDKIIKEYESYKTKAVIWSRSVLAFIILIWIFLVVTAIFVILKFFAVESDQTYSIQDFTWTLEGNSNFESLKNRQWLFGLAAEGRPVVTNITSGSVSYLTPPLIVGDSLSFDNTKGTLTLDNKGEQVWFAGVQNPSTETTYTLKLSITGNLVITDSGDYPQYTFPSNPSS